MSRVVPTSEEVLELLTGHYAGLPTPADFPNIQEVRVVLRPGELPAVHVTFIPQNPQETS